MYGVGSICRQYSYDMACTISASCRRFEGQDIRPYIFFEYSLLFCGLSDGTDLYEPGGMDDYHCPYADFNFCRGKLFRL